VAGEVIFESAGRREVIVPGSAFHVPPGGPPHRFLAPGAARIAGFEAVDPVFDTSDAALAAQGFEVLGPEVLGPAGVIPAIAAPFLDENQIEVRSWAMSSFVLSEARFGPASGYAADWCDAPHWGFVIAGGLALEFEDDIEILAAGDVFHCPGGPPGHRFEAADPAAIVDLTPIEAFGDGPRIAPWRRQAAAVHGPSGTGPIAVAGLG